LRDHQRMHLKLITNSVIELATQLVRSLNDKLNFKTIAVMTAVVLFSKFSYSKTSIPKIDLNIMPIKLTTASFFEPQAEILKKINSEDSDAKDTQRIISLHDKRSYKSCAEDAIQNLKAEETSSTFFVFKFIFGVKCLVEIKSNLSSQDKLLSDWSEFYFVLHTKDIINPLHGPEADLYLNYILKLSELLYLNSESLKLNSDQLQIVEMNLKQTEEIKIKSQIFSGYINKNDQLSAKEFMIKSDPKLRDIPSLEMLFEHFKDEVYSSRIQTVKKSKADSIELKRLYQKNKYSDFLNLLSAADLILEDQVSAASRQAGWFYIRGSEQFRKDVYAKFDDLSINYNLNTSLEVCNQNLNP